MSRTPDELGLATNMRVWAEEAAEEKIKLTLAFRRPGGRADERVDMLHPKTAPLSRLLADFCARHGEGVIVASQLTLRFDGADLPPSQTPEAADLEDEDLIEMRIK